MPANEPSPNKVENDPFTRSGGFEPLASVRSRRGRPDHEPRSSDGFDHGMPGPTDSQILRARWNVPLFHLHSLSPHRLGYLAFTLIVPGQLEQEQEEDEPVHDIARNLCP